MPIRPLPTSRTKCWPNVALARVHHRILFFVALHPGLSVKDLLACLGVTKQAINIPLRQLMEMDLWKPAPPSTTSA